MLHFVKKAFSISQKIFLVFAVYAVIISLFSYFFQKDLPKTSSADILTANRVQIYKTLNDPNLQKTKVDKQLMQAYRLSLCGFIGEACTDNPADGNKNFKESVFGKVSRLMAYPMSQPPASGLYWAYSGLSTAGFVPKAYAAQGVGFAALQPILNIWRVFRNIAYLLLVVVLVSIGFLIMFRLKINPQTVITIENTLPRIIITMILITFSFAISGFLVDLVYIVIGLAASVISNNGILPFKPQELNSALISSGTGGLFDAVFWNSSYLSVGPALMDMLPNVVQVTLTVILSFVVYIGLGRIAFTDSITQGKMADISLLGFGAQGPLEIILSILIAGALFIILAFVAPFILSIVVFLTALIVFLRILIILFKSYLMALILIMFSPIILLLEVIPGKSFFKIWILQMRR